MHFHEDTHHKVKDILESAKDFGFRIRIFYGDSETGKVWPEEFDIIGNVGQSCGVNKIPLLIANKRSPGGCAILDNRILGIVCVKTKQWLYKHPDFDNGEWFCSFHKTETGLEWEVTHNKAVHARFESEIKAKNYVAFMKGERMSK